MASEIRLVFTPPSSRSDTPRIDAHPRSFPTIMSPAKTRPKTMATSYLTPPTTPELADAAHITPIPLNTPSSPSPRPQRLGLLKRKQTAEEACTPAKKSKFQDQQAVQASHVLQKSVLIAENTTRAVHRVILRTKKSLRSSNSAIGIVVDTRLVDQQVTSGPELGATNELVPTTHDALPDQDTPSESSSSSSTDFSEGDHVRTDMIRELEFQAERAIQAINHQLRNKLGPERAPQWIQDWVEERRIEMEEEAELAQAVQLVKTETLENFLKEEFGIAEFEL